MKKESYSGFLLEAIPKSELASGGREIWCRCLECEDSRNPKSKHMYISIPQNEKELSFYNCFKCHCGGVVTHKKLMHWGIFDPDIAMELISHNGYALSLDINRRFTDRQVYSIHNSLIREDEGSLFKLNYINDRLNINLSYKDLLDKKIILNLYDILNENNVKKLTRHKMIADQIDEHFLGFLSLDNAFINCRLLADKGVVNSNIDSRYINYNIFGKHDNTERFYTMPTSVNLSQPNRIKLHIAEGPFDILSIYYNLRKDDRDIYTSVAGSGYKGLIKYFVNVLKLLYIEIHLYPDNDKHGSLHAMEDIAEMIAPFKIPFYVHRNMYANQKDFGVSLNKIKEQVERMI